ncbi:hypothetical protein PSSHI_45460 [Photobacterium sp. R1]
MVNSDKSDYLPIGFAEFNKLIDAVPPPDMLGLPIGFTELGSKAVTVPVSLGLPMGFTKFNEIIDSALCPNKSEPSNTEKLND